jgi:hypothetical protein
VANTRFTRSRLADVDLLPDKNLGAAGLVKTDGMRHGKLLGDRKQRGGYIVAGRDTFYTAMARARIQARRTGESKSNFKYGSQNEKKPGGRAATGHIHPQ